MANKIAHRHGKQIKRNVPFSATAVYMGDLVYLDSNTMKPAASFTWDTSEAVTLAAFADVFLGVCLVQSPASGLTYQPAVGQVDIGPDSVYEFTLTSGTYGLGEELAPETAASALLTQTLQTVAGSQKISIARTFDVQASAVTSCLCSFASAFHPGSSNYEARLGQ